MRHYCTYFDRNFLTRGLALHASLERHAGDYTLWILCLDETVHAQLRALALPNVRLIALPELEAAMPQLAAVRPTRSVVEYYFTCSPCLPLHVLELEPAIDSVTYLDADLYFYSSPSAVFQELGDGSVLIVPHRFPDRLRHLERYGRFNVGLLSFRNDEHGRAMLETWRTQCIEWCFDRVEDGRFADQGYLDAWPGRPGVVVSEHPGVGLGPWNVMRYRVDARSEPPLVDGRPLVFYHFQGVKAMRPRLWDVGLDRYGTRLAGPVRQRLYGGYVAALRRAAGRVAAVERDGRHHGRSLREGVYGWRRILGRILRGQVIVR